MRVTHDDIAPYLEYADLRERFMRGESTDALVRRLKELMQWIDAECDADACIYALHRLRQKYLQHVENKSCMTS
jgi:phosphoribosyl-AMP cyclohydrolase